MFTIRPPSGTSRIPVDICCVIDVSGSMGTEAKLQNSEGKSEAHGLSILDIVLHSVRTIIHILSEHDRLALVVYSTTARTILPLTYMTASGRQSALNSIATLRPEDQTNLWDGLVHGLDILSQDSNRMGHILLLTDGQPNVVPPRGHIPMLQRYKDQRGTLPASIHTFGFGYHLDSALLRDFASLGNGSYNFIPDSGMVGTVFVNSVSNILVTMAKNVTLSIEGKCKVMGGFPTQYTTWGAIVNVGNVQFDQEKNIVVTVTDDVITSGSLTWFSRSNSTATVPSTLAANMEESTLQNYLRLLALDWIRTHTTLDTLPSLLALLTTSPLLPDITGQVTEALSRKDWYDRWGIHYLPSLVFAHQLQQCNNFKDPGIQNYGGKLFQELRDKADDVFMTLPPPKPSAKPSAAPVASMRIYNTAQNGCFSGNCTVTLENGGKKLVKDLNKGDIVFGGAKIVTVIKYSGYFEMVQFHGLEITPHHPISLNGKWEFPINVGKLVNKKYTTVFNFVLDFGHILIVNDVKCVTLGHGFKEEVVEHEYFGSEKVINDLKKMKGWNEGMIELDGNTSAKRDEKTNHVIGFVQEVVC